MTPAPGAPFRRVLVAIDGSDNASRALDVAASLAAATAAGLVVAHAVGLLEEGEMHGMAVEGRAAEVERRVEEWCARLRDSGTEHRVEVLPGSPVPALLTAIERVDADLVVVGSRGIGGYGGRQLGSTSQQLVADSPVPVLVVPPAAGE